MEDEGEVETKQVARIEEQHRCESDRRRALLLSLFPLFDIDGQNVAEARNVNSVLISLERPLAPAKLTAKKLDDDDDADEAPLTNLEEEGPVITVLRIWERCLEAMSGAAKCFSPEQFFTVFQFLCESFSAEQFDSFVDVVTAAVKKLTTVVEASRLSRSAHALFRRFDSQRRGYLLWPDLSHALFSVFGDNLQVFKRVERAKTVASDEINSIITGNKKSLNFDTALLPEVVVIPAVSAFFEGVVGGELESHRQLMALYRYVEQHFPVPRAMAEVMTRQRKEKEKEHLLSWDLKHLLDGVVSKEILKVVDLNWHPPESIEAIAAAVCVMGGIPLAKPRRGGEGAASYWATLRALLKDWPRFSHFLKNFPILSVTHRQAQQVSAHLREPTLSPSYLLNTSIVLSTLVSWVRLILRIVFLEHDFEIPAHVDTQLMSTAMAETNHVLPLRVVEEISKAEEPARVPNIKQLAPSFAWHFESVFDPPPVAGLQSASRFRPVSLKSFEPLETQRRIKLSAQAADDDTRSVGLVEAPCGSPGRRQAAAVIASADQTALSRVLASQRPQSAYIRKAAKNGALISRPASATRTSVAALDHLK